MVPEAGLGSLGNGAFSLGRTHSQHRCSSLNFSPQQDLSSGVFVIAVRFFPQLLVFIKTALCHCESARCSAKILLNIAQGGRGSGVT